MRKHLPLDLMFPVCLFLFLVPTNLPALMVPFGIDDLAGNSEIILRGTVLNQGSRWRGDRGGIVTSVTVSVREVLGGELQQDTVIVEVPGGVVGDVGQTVSDTPSFRNGEEVLLFLRETSSSSKAFAESGSVVKSFTVVGQGQGKYSIGKDGIARRSGFSVTGRSKSADNQLPARDLIEELKNFLGQ